MIWDRNTLQCLATEPHGRHLMPVSSDGLVRPCPGVSVLAADITSLANAINFELNSDQRALIRRVF